MDHDHDHDHIVNTELQKAEYDETNRSINKPRPSPPPSPSKRPISVSSCTRSSPSTGPCLVCRKTLLLSYFNCCAVCLSVIECGQRRKDDDDDNDNDEDRPTRNNRPPILPVSERHPSPPPPPPRRLSSSTTLGPRQADDDDDDDDRRARHCDSAYCRYTHPRLLMCLFVACELVPSLGGLALLNLALYRHSWVLLRFAGMLLLQWWQIFMLPRQFYIEGSRQWRWWEPLAISTVLLKIVFPW
ncbi:uncharacterized protein GGS25DRAFT_517933 [Hypoxylon fragiforme]|uniref:uncharacterized protein n=1 Tax=Hypoxylon fragiforme TaxID=63214 RepID=UPI0020C5CE69|nr:uncharacterized protein GGS25DRAFT_517933 [Hypoxylon fragiforme]KAI2612238.1 hypothetical protein GGS25DRAFT_517933 [Hypoxylon fragiforme]